MAADDRGLRDQLEKLQGQTKVLRSQLEDPARLDAVRAEVDEQLHRLKQARADAAAKLAWLEPQIEQARIESMQRKRERAEQNLMSHVGATARVTFAITTAFCAAYLGVHFGEGSPLHLLGAAACAGGAAGFLGVVWRIGAGLSKPLSPP